MTRPAGEVGVHARWIIVTPSSTDEAWRSAIRAGVAEAGLIVLPHDPAIPVSALQDPKVVIYAQDAATAVAAGAKTITAILPDVASSVAAVQATYQTPRPTSIQNASQLLAGAAALGLDHRVIGADQLKALDGPLRVFPDLLITPPPAAASIAHEDEAAQGIAEILSMYHGGRPRVGAPAAEWSLDSLSYDKRAARTATPARDIDLTGRPRILVYGPYVALPPGLWRAKVRFSIDAAAAGRQFRIDWGAQSHYASETFTPGRAGVYELELDYRWTTAEPAEVRFIIMEGCFSGAASVLGVKVSLIGAADDSPSPIGDTP